MDLTRFPRRRYTDGPTPLQWMAKLSAHVGGPDIWIKRDDLLGGLGGGNKTRKLEFVVGEAMAQGADTLVTCGNIQSNHCRLTASAAAREGLECRLVLEERVAGAYDPGATGNNFLYQLLGAKITLVPGGSDMVLEVEKACEAARAEGRKPYAVPLGASNPVGAVGYAACALELLAQIVDLGLEVDAVVHATGSSGTQAGLVAGFHAMNVPIPVLGMAVDLDGPTLEDLVHSLACRTAERLGASPKVPRRAVVCNADYKGPGYSLPTEAMVEAVTLAARLEGVLLDPVYTGKALAGVIDLARTGRLGKGDTVVFIHTGGSPALYAYRDGFLPSA